MPSDQDSGTPKTVQLAEGGRGRRRRKKGPHSYALQVKRRVQRRLAQRDSNDPKQVELYRKVVDTVKFKSDLIFVVAWNKAMSKKDGDEAVRLTEEKQSFDTKQKAEENAGAKEVAEAASREKKEQRAAQDAKLARIVQIHQINADVVELALQAARDASKDGRLAARDANKTARIAITSVAQIAKVLVNGSQKCFFATVNEEPSSPVNHESVEAMVAQVEALTQNEEETAPLAGAKRVVEEDSAPSSKRTKTANTHEGSCVSLSQHNTDDDAEIESLLAENKSLKARLTKAKAELVTLKNEKEEVDASHQKTLAKLDSLEAEKVKDEGDLRRQLSYRTLEKDTVECEVLGLRRLLDSYTRKGNGGTPAPTASNPT